MAALDFPDSPAVGDLYGAWRWDGTRWASTSGPSGARGRVAYAQVTTSQSGIPNMGWVDLTGLSVSWVADPTRTYRITGFAVFIYVGGPSGAEMDIYDGARRVQIASVLNLSPSYGSSLIIQAVESGLSGTQTRKLSALGLGNTVATSQAPTYPAFILVEDITLEQGNTSGAGSPLKANAMAKLSALVMSGSVVNIPFASSQSSNTSVISFNNAAGQVTIGRAGNYLVGVSYAVNVSAPTVNAYFHTMLYQHAGVLIGEDVSPTSVPYHTCNINGIWFGAQPGQLIQAQVYCAGGPGVTIRQGNLWVVEL